MAYSSASARTTGTVLEAGGAELLQALSFGPATWLRTRVCEMLSSSALAPDPEGPIPANLPKVEHPPATPKGREPRPGSHRRGRAQPGRRLHGWRGDGRSHRPRRATGLDHVALLSSSARMKFRFFSFGSMGRPDTWATRETPVAVTEDEEHGQAGSTVSLILGTLVASAAQAKARAGHSLQAQSIFDANLALSWMETAVPRQPMAVGALLSLRCVRG